MIPIPDTQLRTFMRITTTKVNKRRSREENKGNEKEKENTTDNICVCVCVYMCVRVFVLFFSYSLLTNVALQFGNTRAHTPHYASAPTYR
jgi:hypothetical protein